MGVVDDGDSGSGGRNVARDGVALGAGEHGAPVLQALGERVVRALRDNNAVVDEKLVLAAAVLDGGQDVFSASLEAENEGAGR